VNRAAPDRDDYQSLALGFGRRDTTHSNAEMTGENVHRRQFCSTAVAAMALNLAVPAQEHSGGARRWV
jgi:hypothetical protein